MFKTCYQLINGKKQQPSWSKSKKFSAEILFISEHKMQNYNKRQLSVSKKKPREIFVWGKFCGSQKKNPNFYEDDKKIFAAE